jgi:hypothetical protein
LRKAPPPPPSCRWRGGLPERCARRRSGARLHPFWAVSRAAGALPMRAGRRPGGRKRAFPELSPPPRRGTRRRGWSRIRSKAARLARRRPWPRAPSPAPPPWLACAAAASRCSADPRRTSKRDRTTYPSLEAAWRHGLQKSLQGLVRPFLELGLGLGQSLIELLVRQDRAGQQAEGYECHTKCLH